MSYDKDMSGTLGRNKRREKDTHPEYTGKCQINGVWYWISAWVKEGQGEKFFSLAFKPQEQQARQAPPPPGRRAPSRDDEDVPF